MLTIMSDLMTVSAEVAFVRKLFFSGEPGLARPQYGQAATERLTSFLQLGQSREPAERGDDFMGISSKG